MPRKSQSPSRLNASGQEAVQYAKGETVTNIIVRISSALFCAISQYNLNLSARNYISTLARINMMYLAEKRDMTVSRCLAAIFFFFLLLCLSACTHPTADVQDAFFDEWRIKAEESIGYSPPPKEHKLEITDIFLTLDDDEEEEPPRPLPENTVSLKFREVDIRVIMRALARAADQNIIMSSSVRGSLSINIHEMPWYQAFLSIMRTHGLTYIWEGDIIRVMSIEDMQRDIQIENVRNERMTTLARQKRLEPLQTSVVRVRYTDPEMLQQNLVHFLGANSEDNRGSVFVDKHNNALVIQAIEEETRRVLRLVQNLDQPRPQVLLKAHIVETTQDTARDLGVQWGGRYRSPRLMSSDRLFISPGSVATIPDADRPDRIPWGALSPVGPFIDFPASIGEDGSASLSLMYGILDGNILEMQLSALQSEGKLNILSSPSITTLDNQMAFTENGERVPYVSRDSDGDPEVKFEDAVLRLEITPNIIDEDQLRLAISVKKDEVDLSRTVQGNPFIIKKHTETNLVVANSETIVISGLTRERNIRTMDGVPGLHKIPGVGSLFRHDSRGKLMEEVLIFITPHILPHRPPYSRDYVRDNE